jgi:hypothetical protein
MLSFVKVKGSPEDVLAIYTDVLIGKTHIFLMRYKFTLNSARF